MYYKKLFDNPLKSYDDLLKACKDTINPYLPFFSPGNARIDLGPPGATFSNNAYYLEGFARLLWALVPYVAGGNEYRNWEQILEGLSNGVDPHHYEFWGWPGDYDQLLVEMAVFGYALCIIPDKIWKPLNQKTKNNFTHWLSYINTKKIPDCNWIFFRILVNLGLKRVAASEFNQHLLHESLELVEKFYLKDGWYNDGIPRDRRARDYYIPWAIHYYSLILVRCCKEELGVAIISKFEDRARRFAQDFIFWFARDGSALPYGRSLTYRYAQSAFWSALAMADVEALPWGRIKGLLLRNLRWWFRQPIYSETGLLTVGYAYPNLHMAERYNSPNSPLWALKAYIALALGPDHAFWQAEEQPLKKQEEEHLQENTGFIICDSQKTGHLYALNAGQWTPGPSNAHNHMAEKYAKFAYSNYFGFNVTTDTYGIDKLAPDNMLLIDGGSGFYAYRKETYEHKITPGYLYSKWSPCSNIEIETYLLAYGAWSLRLHHIISNKSFHSVEGGFALPYNDAFYPITEEIQQTTPNESYTKTQLGFSVIKNLTGQRQGRNIIANPNTNIIYPHTLIPTLHGKHTGGDVWLACAVMAHSDPEQGERIWKHGINLQKIIKKLPVTIQKMI